MQTNASSLTMQHVQNNELFSAAEMRRRRDTVRAELKEMKALFNAAGQQADAAGADEETLRKRLSQLMCENGLLKGEKERREALDASMKMESRSAVARAAGEVERPCPDILPAAST